MMDYKNEYEEELERNALLAERIAELEEEKEELSFKLNRIKTNPVWKASAPLRKAFHFCSRNFRRIKNLGGPRGIAHKIAYKKREREAM